LHSVAFSDEIHAGELYDVRVVVDNEDSCHLLIPGHHAHPDESNGASPVVAGS
jgi:hypothetical protein